MGAALRIVSKLSIKTICRLEIILSKAYRCAYHFPVLGRDQRIERILDQSMVEVIMWARFNYQILAMERGMYIIANHLVVKIAMTTETTVFIHLIEGAYMWRGITVWEQRHYEISIGRVNNNVESSHKKCDVAFDRLIVFIAADHDTAGAWYRLPLGRGNVLYLCDF